MQHQDNLIKTKIGTWNIGWVSEGTYQGKIQTTKDKIVNGIANQIDQSMIEICCIQECSSSDLPVTMMQTVVGLLNDRDLQKISTWDYAFSSSISSYGKLESVCWLYRSDVFYFQRNYSRSLISDGVRGTAMASFRYRAISRTGLLLFGVHFKANALQTDVDCRIGEASCVSTILGELCLHKNLAVLGDFNEDLSDIGAVDAAYDPFLQPESSEDEDADDDRILDLAGRPFPSLASWWRQGHHTHCPDESCNPMLPALSKHENTKLLDSEPRCLDNILVVHESMTRLDNDVPGTVHTPLVEYLVADHRLVTAGLLLVRGDRSRRPAWEEEGPWPPVYETFVGSCEDEDSEGDEDEGAICHAVSRMEVYSEIHEDISFVSRKKKKELSDVKRGAAITKRQGKL